MCRAWLIFIDLHHKADQTMTNHPIPTGKYNAAILAYLAEQDRPRSAYDILDALRDEGIKAPMQIYRALAKLEAVNLVHKLPKSNSWMACHTHHHNAQQLLLLLSCQSCGIVAEIEDDTLQTALAKVTQNSAFDMPAQTIEVDGVCKPCKDGDI